MMKFVVLTLTVALILQEGLALDCYSCKGTEACKKPEKKSCGTHIGKNQKAVCTTQEKKDDANSIQKDCVIVESTKKADCPQGFECQECEGDLCNKSGASTIYANYVTFAGLAVVYLVSKYLF